MRGLFKRKTRRERFLAWRKRQSDERTKGLKKWRERKNWARFLAYLGRHKARPSAVACLVTAASALEIVLPRLARFVLDHVVPVRNPRLLASVILGGMGIYLIHSVIRYLEQRSVVTLSMDVMTEIRRDLYDFQLRLPLSYFEKFTPGKLISKLTYSTQMIRTLLETFAYVCFRECVLIAFIVGSAVLIDWRLSLLFFGLAPFFIYYIVRLNRYMAEIASTLQTKNDEILRQLDRTFNAIKLYKIFGLVDRGVAELSQVLEEDKFYRVRRTLVYSVNAIVIGLLTSLIVLGALWYGGHRMIQGRLSYGDVTAYLIYFGMLFRPVSDLIRASAYWQAGKIGVQAVFSVFDRYPAEPTGPRLAPVEPKQGSMELRHVWFRHEGGGQGLKNISFNIQPGEKVLILGPSGSGKSTLFHLLLGLYNCERGSILLDGRDVRFLSPESLREYFTVVTQDQLHTEDTVLNNVFLTPPDRNDPSVLRNTVDLAQKVGMGAKLIRREKKYGERLSSNDLRFSRGELQRLALMRAAQKAAPIVLLDEPTASLDRRSEEKILQFISEKFADKTVLMIAHRPQPLFRATRIIRLREGRIDQDRSLREEGALSA